MIYISQGHEKGIGLEVFFKSILSLGNTKNYILVAFRKSIEETLNSLQVNYSFSEKHLILNKFLKLSFIEPTFKDSETISCLNYCLDIMTSNDVLFTLPSSKDQFISDNLQSNGHTEYFREYFKIKDLSMFFNLNDSNVLLLSDHIPLKDVSTFLTEEIIINKVMNCLKFKQFKDVYFSGINPHAGEEGLLGNEDKIINKAINKLKANYKNINFHGPLSGDTLYFNKSLDNLLVYSFHDQALAAFKTHNKLFGANITLGMPFIRYSVDHGTAFNLFGKNVADYRGCLNILRSLT